MIAYVDEPTIEQDCQVLWDEVMLFPDRVFAACRHNDEPQGRDCAPALRILLEKGVA